jgi:hypothetical protein
MESAVGIGHRFGLPATARGKCEGQFWKHDRTRAN